MAILLRLFCSTDFCPFGCLRLLRSAWMVSTNTICWCNTTLTNRFCTYTIEPSSGYAGDLYLLSAENDALIVSSAKAIPLRTLMPNPIGTTAVAIRKDCYSCAISQMRLFLAFAGCLCLLLSLTFRRHLPSLCLARKPNQDTSFSSIKTHYSMYLA
mgnify:CR=1 FL=1